MGFLKKVTGVQGQIDAMNRNADSQIAAAKSAAQAQTKALNDAAQATAEAQAQAAARSQVEAAAREAVSKPLDVADVALDVPTQGSSIAAARRRRNQFGQNYDSGTGVGI
jgi:hypothetical protein